MANRINRYENKLRKVMLQPRAPQSSDVLWGALGPLGREDSQGRIELNTNVILVDKGNYSATQQRYSI